MTIRGRAIARIIDDEPDDSAGAAVTHMLAVCTSDDQIVYVPVSKETWEGVGRGDTVIVYPPENER